MSLAKAASSSYGCRATTDLRQRPSWPKAQPEPQPEEESAADRPRLLIIEDEPDLRGYLTRLFTKDGYAVEAAGDAETALTLLESNAPDMVITDVMLPGQSGLDLLTALRQDERMARLPVVVLTARADAESAVEAFAAGADDFVVKPFNSAELLARVRAHDQMNQLRDLAIGAAETTVGQLRQALQTNRTIGTAVGIVMARYELDRRTGVSGAGSYQPAEQSQAARHRCRGGTHRCLCLDACRLTPLRLDRTRSGCRSEPLTASAPIGDRLLHVDEPDNDRRTVKPAPVGLGDPVVQIGHDLAYGFLVSDVGQRLGKRHDLLAECQRGRQRKRELLPLQIGLDPPVLIVATIQALDRPALPGQVVELSALDRLADLTVHPAFVRHVLIFSNARYRSLDVQISDHCGLPGTRARIEAAELRIGRTFAGEQRPLALSQLLAHRAGIPRRRRRSQRKERLRSLCAHYSLRSLRLALVSRCLPHPLADEKRVCSLARPGQRRASLAQHGGARFPTLAAAMRPCGTLNRWIRGASA